MSYDFARTVPPEDPDLIYFNEFKEQFGEDGNIIAVGMKDSSIYELKNFQYLRELTDDIKKIYGVNEVVALPTLKMILKDTANTKFYLSDIFPTQPASQVELDSLLGITLNQRIYAGQLLNTNNGAMMMLVSVQKEVMNSAKREAMTDSLLTVGKIFEGKTNIQLRYAGLPFMRTVVANSIRNEMKIFLIASVVVTGLIMFLFFRSFRAVLFSMIILVC